MKDSNTLIQAAQAKTQTLSADTATPAGQTASDSASEKPASPDCIEAIQKLFATFELVYHNQYNKAFPTADKENLAKQLWLSHLKLFSGEQITRAAEKAVRSSEFLPTVFSVLKYINHSQLPSAHDAYLECCQSGTPKREQNWSHPVVYWAGKQSGWHYLSSTSESQAFPVFKEKYQRLCEQQAQGKAFELPEPQAEPSVQLEHIPVEDAETAKTKLKELFS